MGSLNTKNFEAAENKLALGEIFLPFSVFNVKRTNQLIAAHCDHDEINASAWDEFLSQLYLEETCLVHDFFNSFCNFDRNFPGKPLYVLGILVSKGTILEKTLALFEKFKLESKTTKKNISELISIMLEISIEKLPLIIRNKDTDLLQYVEALRQRKKIALEWIMEKFEEDSNKEINFSSFLNVFNWNPQLLTPSGLRKIVGSYEKV